MLTLELLRQNQILSGLTDDQLTAIATMSANDEASVIGVKIGELHGQYDVDVLKASGIKKNDGEKSYDYVKRVLNTFKSNVDSVKADNVTLQDKIKTLEEATEKNADEQLKQKLVDSNKTIEQLRAQITANEQKYANEKKSLEANIKQIHIDYEFNAAMSKLNIKENVSEAVKNIMFEAAKREVLSKYTPELVESNGTKNLIFRDANGAIANNPANNMQPYTTLELVNATSIKDIVEVAKVQPGGGTGPTKTNINNVTLIDISSAKNQVEADKLIAAHLMQRGLTSDSAEFAAESIKLRQDNNVAALPIR